MPVPRDDLWGGMAPLRLESGRDTIGGLSQARNTAPGSGGSMTTHVSSILLGALLALAALFGFAFLCRYATLMWHNVLKPCCRTLRRHTWQRTPLTRDEARAFWREARLAAFLCALVGPVAAGIAHAVGAMTADRSLAVGIVSWLAIRTCVILLANRRLFRSRQLGGWG